MGSPVSFATGVSLVQRFVSNEQVFSKAHRTFTITEAEVISPLDKCIRVSLKPIHGTSFRKSDFFGGFCKPAFSFFSRGGAVGSLCSQARRNTERRRQGCQEMEGDET